MTTQEVANKFYEMAQKGDWDGIQNELYSDDAKSIEPDFAPEPRVVQGREALQKKAEYWNSLMEETHGGYCNEPVVAGNHFSCAMGMDVTMKEGGRVQMDEICVYEVQNGKIVKEQFFYENDSPK